MAEADKAAFIEASQPIYAQFAKELPKGQALIDQVQKSSIQLNSTATEIAAGDSLGIPIEPDDVADSLLSDPIGDNCAPEWQELIDAVVTARRSIVGV